MIKFLTLCSLCAASTLISGQYAFSHDNIAQYSMHGNYQKGVATKAMGAKQFEVWKASLAVGSKTPLHVHESEEIFILIKGDLLAKIGDEEVRLSAPATLICPANVPHQLFNVGTEPTEQIDVLGIDSKISDASGTEMRLPWR